MAYTTITPRWIAVEQACLTGKFLATVDIAQVKENELRVIHYVQTYTTYHNLKF